MAVNHIGSIHQKYKINEPEKYNIYLDMKDDFESASSENLYNVVKNK